MNQNQIVFAIDAGNTFLKVAKFQAGLLQNVHRIQLNQLQILKDILNSELYETVILSTVLSDKDTKAIVDCCNSCTILNNRSKLPITLRYESPISLGFDRICNAVAGMFLEQSKNCVTIDIGTCIKFDFTDLNGNYFGGSISPGIQLRYRSMNDYTGKLPLLNDVTSAEIVGNNTENSMRSGVMNGMQGEIDHFIQWYTEQYQDLTFFVTGGDAVYFDFQSKNNIFVQENLTLIGLYQIYLFNA